MLLRLVSQSARRVERYSALLAEAYEAAERLKQAQDAQQLVTDGSDVTNASREQAAMDLERIFNLGGVAALVGYKYGAAGKEGDIYATGEAIRGLAELEAEERDRCANFAGKAINAGLQAEVNEIMRERQTAGPLRAGGL